MFAGIYYWYPKITGRQMSETLGKIHFWGSLLAINGIFFPMFAQGLAGVSRRLYDGGEQYAHAKLMAASTNPFMSISAWTLLAFQLPFIFNFFKSIKWGERVGSNPWQATTLEWAAATSPPLGHGNFATEPVVYRGPYEYSFPGHEFDYYPQNVPEPAPPVEPAPAGGGLPQTAVAQREA
jgi:cytochrome c oxidase subunit 1